MNTTVFFFPACGMGKWSLQTAWDWQYKDRFNYTNEIPCHPLSTPDDSLFIEKSWNEACVVRV